MRKNYMYILLLLLIYSCSSSTSVAISKLKEYNTQIKHFVVDSSIASNISSINSLYESTISSIPSDEIDAVSSDKDFQELLQIELKLMNKWAPIEDYKSYDNKVNSGSQLDLVRRCSSYDRAPSSASRVPVIKGLRLASLSYYKVEIPVAFHIITSQQGKGQLPDMQLKVNNQIKILNDVYNKFNIKFKLVSTDVTVNDIWFRQASYYDNVDALRQMTTSLSKNPENIMNVYSTGAQILGEATFPWGTDKGTSMDYIVINYNTLPSGPDDFCEGKYNEGKTLVHEVGHFLGLFHTFEGASDDCSKSPPNNGCTKGDQVDDTPSQLICYFEGCDEDSDSCPDPGKDPVRNFMGYNPDYCMTQLTDGQGERLLQCIIKFRYYLIANPIH